MNDNYKKRLSDAITWLRFPLIFFIILLHCYSVQRLEGSHDTYFKILYPFSLWLGETGVPAFFFISGLLFFLSNKNYFQKQKTRIFTLLVPYILWNSLLVFTYIILLYIGHPMEIIGRSIADYNVIDFIRLYWDRGFYDDGNFVPILCPLWYIRNLIIMSILSPIFYYLIKYLREPFLLFVAIWWLMTPRNAFIPQTVFFFCIGAYFSILNVNPLKVIIEKRILFTTLFIIFGLFDILSHVLVSTPINLHIHRLSLICNIPILFIIADFCMRHGFHHDFLPKSAFIVFCVHYPIVVLLRKICISTFYNANDGIHILLYWICVIISTLLSLGIYYILDKYFPKLKNLLSGNR